MRSGDGEEVGAVLSAGLSPVEGDTYAVTAWAYFSEAPLEMLSATPGVVPYNALEAADMAFSYCSPATDVTDSRFPCVWVGFS